MPQYNLLITKGADFALTLAFSEGFPVRASGAALGATTMPLSAELIAPLYTGDRVDFSGQQVELTVDAELGEKSLSVVNLDLTVPAGIGYKVTDLTGYTITSSLQPPTGDPIPFTITTASPETGTTVLSLTEAQTALLNATLPVGEFPSVPDLQCRKYSGIEYLWSLTLDDGIDTTTVPIGGLAFVGVVDGTFTSLNVTPPTLTAVQQCQKVRLGFGYPPVSGGGGGTTDLTFTAVASINLSALRVALVDGGQMAYADPSDTTQAARGVGLLLNAASQGTTATAHTKVLTSDNSWNWDTTLPIWLGANGTLTQTAPTSGYSRLVATPITPTSIDFSPQEATLL